MTLTTVGFEEKAPVTFLGRTIALLWMFISVILISSFTATITSTITLKSLNNHIQSIDDLEKHRVGTAVGTTSDEFLSGVKLKHQNFPNIIEAMNALETNKLDAVVFDKPILEYMVKQKSNTKLTVLPIHLTEENYALAVGLNSPLRKQINIKMLELMNSPRWKLIQSQYF